MGEPTLGDRLHRFRTEAGLSLSQLARDAEISKGYLHKLEHTVDDHVRPSGATVARIAEALGVDVTDLLGTPQQPGRPHLPAGLAELARIEDLPQADVDALDAITWSGHPPITVRRWRHIWLAIRLSEQLDRNRT